MTRRAATFSAIAFLVLCSLIYCAAVIIPDGEIGQAKGWELLKGAERQYRSASDKQAPILLDHAFGSSYTTLGVPQSDDQYPRTWMILNDHWEHWPLRFVDYHGKIQVSCSYVTVLRPKVDIDDKAWAFLTKKCSG